MLDVRRMTHFVLTLQFPANRNLFAHYACNANLHHNQRCKYYLLQRPFVFQNMTSRAFTQGSFFNPIASPEIPSKDERTPNYRHPTVYDAVAGMTCTQVPFHVLILHRTNLCCRIHSKTNSCLFNERYSFILNQRSASRDRSVQKQERPNKIRRV
jgi:hypothetical protein